MNEMLPSLATADALGVDSTFVEYKRFEDDAEIRASQRDAFIRGESWAPEHDYPSIDQLYDAKDDKDTDAEALSFLIDRKANIQRAIYRLELAKSNGEIHPDEAELYAAFHELRLKRIMLVEAARRLHYANSSAEVEVARAAFIALNVELFGEFDAPTYHGMLSTERNALEAFEPQNDIAVTVKQDLGRFFAGKHLPEVEAELFDSEVMARLHEYVTQRYADILAVVPDDDENVVYDAQQCRDMIQRALDVAGLAEKGWKAVVDAKKSNPSTAANKQKISLPSNMARTPSELRRLILHEVEAHARRGQNGKDAGSNLLKRGTADYADVEEGYGVLLECILAGNFDNPSFYRARDRYIVAGLALGVADQPRDSRQTFEIMWRLIAVRNAQDGVITEDIKSSAMDQAYIHVDNAFRGTNFAMAGVIYMKLKIYFEGLQKNAKYFKDRINNLDEAFETAEMGKCDHTDDQEVARFRTVAGLASRP